MTGIKWKEKSQKLGWVSDLQRMLVELRYSLIQQLLDPLGSIETLSHSGQSNTVVRRSDDSVTIRIVMHRQQTAADANLLQQSLNHPVPNVIV